MGGAKIKEYKEISFKLKGGYNQLGYASALLYFTFQADCGNNGGGVQFFKVFILLKKWAGAWPPAPPPPQFRRPYKNTSTTLFSHSLKESCFTPPSDGSIGNQY